MTPRGRASRKRARRRALALAGLAVWALAGAPGAAAEEDEGALDGFNRANRRFNDWLLHRVVKPVARGYNVVVPKLAQDGIENFMLNLERPRDIANSLLQGKPVRAGRHLAALFFNTLWGFGGLVYVSDKVLDDDSPETFNETLGVYRIPPGAFLILPILGETSPRQLVGTAVDSVMNPTFWLIGGTTGIIVSGSRQAVRGVNTVATLMPAPFASEENWEAFEDRISAVTPYPEAKQLYFENQRFDVKD